MLLTEYNEKKHIRMEREDAYDEGKAEGKAELVTMIRRKVYKGMSASEIAELLELDISYVSKVVKLIAEDANRTDLQVAAKLLSEKD